MKARWWILLIICSLALCSFPALFLSYIKMDEFDQSKKDSVELPSPKPKTVSKKTEPVKITDDSKSIEMTVPSNWQFNTKGAFLGGKKIGHRIVASNDLDKYEKVLTSSDRVFVLDGLNAVDVQVSFNQVVVFEPVNCEDREVREDRIIMGHNVRTTIHRKCGKDLSSYIITDSGQFKAVVNEQVRTFNFVMTSFFSSPESDKMVRSIGDSTQLKF